MVAKGVIASLVTFAKVKDFSAQVMDDSPRLAGCTLAALEREGHASEFWRRAPNEGH